MYKEAIKGVLQKMDAVPECLLEMYLQTRFSLKESLCKQSIYSAMRDNACFRFNEYITRAPVIDMGALVKKKGEIFRLVIHFLPESDEFITGQTPWLVSFIRSGKLVQICYIEMDSELIQSRMIAEAPVPLAERDFIRRIAVLAPGGDATKIKAAGISHICQITSDYEIQSLETRPQDTAWMDVPDV